MFSPRTKRFGAATTAAVAAALVLVGCSSSNPLDTPDETTEPDGNTITIGSQAYFSNEIVAEIYAQALEGSGFEVDRRFNIGERDAYMPELESGAIDLFPEYTGNLLQYYDADAAVTSSDDVYAALKDALPAELVALDYSEASDQDTYTVTKEFAAANDLTTIADLAKVDGTLTIGGAPEFEQRPYGPAGAKELYGVDLAFSATGETTLESLLSGEVQVADVYTASPAFQTEDIVALADPENLILASNVVPIASSDVADDISDAIDQVSAALGADDLIAMGVQSTVDQLSADEIATQWLTDNGLL